MPRKKAYKYSDKPIKVGDWVLPTNVQVGKFEPAYQCTDITCLLYTSPSPRDRTRSRMPSSA